MIFLKKLWCSIFGHDILIIKHLQGNIKHGTRLIYCPRCKEVFIMSDDHHSFLEFGKDNQFQEDICMIYDIDPWEMRQILLDYI